MKEIYIDRVSNISVQGPVTSIEFARAKTVAGQKELDFEPKITLTLTTQNLMGLIAALNKTGEAIIEKNKNKNLENKSSAKSEKGIEKQ